MKRFGMALIVVAVFALACSEAEQTPEELALEVSHDTMSPFCPGSTLHDCPSDAALRLRDDIEFWAAQGMTEQEIKDRLVEQFGDSVLAVPNNSWLIWAIPGVALLFGFLIAARVAKRWRVEGYRTTSETGHRSAQEQQRLDAAIGEVRDRQRGPGPLDGRR